MHFLIVGPSLATFRRYSLLFHVVLIGLRVVFLIEIYVYVHILERGVDV